MAPWSLAAVGCLGAAGCSLLVGQWALAGSHDIAALYWLLTGAVTLRAAIVMAASRAS